MALACGYGHRVPLHHPVAANAICYRRLNPVSGADAHDSYRCFGDICFNRTQRHLGHRGFHGDRRCGLNRAFHGWRICHRPQDRLLARLNAQKQETWKFLGTLVSAATVGGVIIVLSKVYGFTGDNALVAPQADAMAKVIEPLMMGGDTSGFFTSGRCYSLFPTAACRHWLSASVCSFRCRSSTTCLSVVRINI